jgi:hypothetical protein
MAAMLGAPAKAHGPEGQQQEKRKKESILDLTKFLEKPVRVKFAGNFTSKRRYFYFISLIFSGIEV